MTEKPIGELEFLRKLQRLLAEGDFVATYKFALLNALADLSLEREPAADGSLRLPVSAIAEKFIEYYWPQARPYRAVDGTGFVLVQAWFAVRFVLMLRKPAAAAFAEEKMPKAAVLLALRGADPFLRQTLAGLLAQDYPDYQLVIVVDHAQDDACRLIEEVQSTDRSGRIRMAVLGQRLPSCSLKNSALIQAVNGLDESRGRAAPAPSFGR